MEVKVTYYTHPSCPTSLVMQPDWQLFVDKFREMISFHFCMSRAEMVAEPVGDTGSSFSACLAVKAASMQSPRAADWYLDKLREAVKAGADIASDNLLFEIARDISKEHRTHFSYQRFGESFISKMSRQALVSDFNKIDHNRIDQVPTLTFTLNGRGIKLSGHSSFKKMADAVERLLPGKTDRQSVINVPTGV